MGKKFLPVCLDLEGKKCTVVGGGRVAARKLRLLVDCGARVTVISPELQQDLAELCDEGRIRWIRRQYRKGDLEGATIVISATGDREMNHVLCSEARERGILVNVANESEMSDFIMPAFFRRGDLTIAVSTSGESPAFARKIKAKLEEELDDGFKILLSLVAEVRRIIKKSDRRVDARDWEEALDLELLMNRLRLEGPEKTKELLLERLGRMT